MGKKTEYRFGVRAQNRQRSSLWVMSIPRNRSDVYLTAMPLGGKLKVSIHESGKCQASITSEFYRVLDNSTDTKPSSRHFKKWNIKEINSGVSLALRILIPSSGLFVDQQELNGSATQIQPLWIQAAPKDKGTEFALFTTTPNTKVTICPGHRSMGEQVVIKHTLPNDNILWLLYRSIDIPRIIGNQIGRMRPLAKDKVDECEVRDFFNKNPEANRAVLLCEDLDGVCLVETRFIISSESQSV